MTTDSILTRLINDDSGQDLVEYALIGAIVAVAGATLFPGLRTKMAEVLGQWGVNIDALWVPSDPT